MNAIMVCVDYAKELAVTLPYNRDRFDNVLVITSNADSETAALAEQHGCLIFRTDCFWEGKGAEFRKWYALNKGIAEFKPSGWTMLLDPDVLLPKKLKFSSGDKSVLNVLEPNGRTVNYAADCLYGPLRRMWAKWPEAFDVCQATNIGGTWMPQESHWHQFSLHPQQHEWAGFCLLFNADSPHLQVCGQCGKRKAEHPNHWCQLFGWFDGRWLHAGGGDSEFQARWPLEKRVRPAWEVLHIGPAGQNWAGRAKGQEGLDRLRKMVRDRTQGPRRFDHEKLR